MISWQFDKNVNLNPYDKKSLKTELIDCFQALSSAESCLPRDTVVELPWLNISDSAQVLQQSST